MRAVWPSLVAGAAVLALVVAAIWSWGASEPPALNWPADAPLAEALAYYSVAGEPSEGLYPFMAREPVYMSAASPCGETALLPGDAAGLAVADYRDGVLYYGFDTPAALSAWADEIGASDCYLVATGGEIAAILVDAARTPYLVMNVDTGLVLFNSDDLHEIAAIGSELEL